MPPGAPRPTPPRFARWYLVYALCVVVAAVLLDLRGMNFTSTERRSDVPRSVRDNPGAYRPVYRGGARYYGGK